MYTEFILVGILRLVSCTSLSSGLSQAVTTPVYLTTSSSQPQIRLLPLYTSPTAFTTSVVVTNVDSFSIPSSTACPALVARNNDDNDAALLAAMDYWASAFHNTNYLSLADTINQAIKLANIANSCDSNGTTTEPPPTDPNTPPTVPDSPPKKKRNPWQRFLD
ncbi:hypothetical protein OCU04_003737 [Sclerotinia nivalis]|uniref:Uncharacterized protein n=1 Tax=Sclerotinia nivalis TaxID=352851 RepID=A0A9X0ASJ2_9HELO|nr:hypothetical protein OCU04_003737 [Sclerotinia nivalis]